MQSYRVAWYVREAQNKYGGIDDLLSKPSEKLIKKYADGWNRTTQLEAGMTCKKIIMSVETSQIFSQHVH